MTVITDTGEIALENLAEGEEPGDLEAFLQATDEPTKDRLQFHVQMTGYTLEEMDNLIVEAAAQKIVGKRTDTAIAKEIEAKCAEIITQRINATLAGITAEIIDQPVTPKYGSDKPITMREMIGLVGRQYLMEMVNSDGKTKAEMQDSYRWEGWGSRIDWIVKQNMSRHFREEIDKATREMIAQAQLAAHETHRKFINEKKAQVARALSEIAS